MAGNNRNDDDLGFLSEYCHHSKSKTRLCVKLYAYDSGRQKLLPL